MNYYIFTSVLTALAAISIWIGVKTSSQTKTTEDYYLSGRNLGFVNLTLTFLATQLGGGAIIGGAEAASKYGWYAIYYSLGLALGLVVLSLGVGGIFRRMDVQTIPQIFGKIYKSAALQKFASVLTIISFFLILVAIGVAARKFFATIGFESPYVFFGFWTVVILYTVMGGLSAVVKTDVPQTVFIIGTFLLVYLYIIPIKLIILTL